MKKIIGVLVLTAVLIFKISAVWAKGLVRDLNVNGVMSLNWRMIGPEKQGFENTVQHEIYLADMYFGFDGKISGKFPFLLEFQIPTASQGRINLYRFSTELLYEEKYKLELGKFLIPFGHYNELYRPDQFLTVTRPLLYASPDSLDIVSRLNSPHPPMSAGYSDIGLKVGYYPQSGHFWIPTEIIAYLVNGLGETPNRIRIFQNSNNLLVPGVAIGGTDIDFGHLNNNLADNNNNKAPGGRIVFALGDLKIPTIFEEKKIELNGIRLGLSGMHGRYDLEEAIAGQDYQIFGTDLIFQYKNYSFSVEYVYSKNDFRKAQADSIKIVDFAQRTDYLPSKTEINKGYYLQAAFPIWKNPPVGKKVLGILAFNKLERIGPELVFSKNKNPADQLPITAFASSPQDLKTFMNKYTAGLNWQIADNFIMKAEYSYWKIKVPPVFGSTQSSIYQPAFSWVFSF
ncbi:MAG: hypothetical protein HYY86_01705 [Candidatus Harrisonbacteria bacterium]|nr:hypothetical protein [Candidatus Harrisonbacteria bacterium]